MWLHVTFWLDEGESAYLAQFASPDFGPFDNAQDVIDVISQGLGERWRRCTQEEMQERAARSTFLAHQAWHQLSFFDPE